MVLHSLQAASLVTSAPVLSSELLVVVPTTTAETLGQLTFEYSRINVATQSLFTAGFSTTSNGYKIVDGTQSNMTLYIIIVSASVVAALAIVCSVAYLWMRNGRRRPGRRIKIVTDSATGQDLEAQTTTMTSTASTSMRTTLMATSHELSVPGYLLSRTPRTLCPAVRLPVMVKVAFVTVK